MTKACACESPVTLQGERWAEDRARLLTIDYWPDDAAAIKAVQPLGDARSWRGRRIPLQITRDEKAIDFWFEGQWIGRIDHPASEPAVVSIRLNSTDELVVSDAMTHAGDWRFTPLHLVTADTPLARWTEPAQTRTLAGVPFARHDHQPPLDLRHAQWVDWQSDPGDFYEFYDGGPYIIHDPRMTVLRLPAQDLTAVHLLAAASDDPQLDDIVTLRVGRFGGVNHRVVFHDFEMRIPRPAATASHPHAVMIDGERYVPIRIPIAHTIAQDLGGVMQIEITKKVRLAVRHPDPNRFRLRPLGMTTGVKVAAVTLERPAVSMVVGSDEVGHAFNQPQTPRFNVQLQNQSDQLRAGKVIARATSRDGDVISREAAYKLAAAGKATVHLDLPVKARGYYDVTVTLHDNAGRGMLERQTSMALLPPLASRHHRDQSPFGCWDFGGQHHTSADPDEVGPLYEKLGFRYGMFPFTSEERARWGVMKGSEPTITNHSSRQQPGASANTYARTVERHPDQVPYALIFHEGVITNIQAQRAPDLFHNRPPYVMTQAEEARFDRLWNDALASARYMRQHMPQIHLRFGNGLLTFKETFYARGFPSELFDSGGNEAGSFSRPPETQPPDPVAYNASIWMDRMLLDAHGYADKPVTQCYEIGCSSSNPGNLSLATQADYVTRMALISMAWGMTEIRPGLISDAGNSYYFSHWGAAGFVHAYPELNVKPVFVAMATLTWVLDGAKLVQEMPTGSPTIHSLLFQRADGDHVHALWTLQGQRTLTLQLAPGQKAVHIDDQGRETPLEPDVLDRVTVTISTSPSYVRSRDGSSVVSLASPEYAHAAPAKLLDPLTDFTHWQVQTQPDPVLDYYNTFTPRMLGDFNWTLATCAAADRPVWRVTPAAIPASAGPTLTMPRYMAIRHEKGIALPEDAGALSLMVNGNGS